MLICMLSRGLRFCSLLQDDHFPFAFALDVSETHSSFCFRPVLQEVLIRKETFQSLRRDVLPYLVRSQLVGLFIPSLFRSRYEF